MSTSVRYTLNVTLEARDDEEAEKMIDKLIEKIKLERNIASRSIIVQDCWQSDGPWWDIS
jgi:uncharacterized protein with PIN domain